VADDLISNLKASSKRWATQITQEATKNLGKFKTLIRVTSKTVEQEGGKLSITSTGHNIAKRDGEMKRVARAYEYGSGMRSKKNRRKITIAPRKKRFLAFYWEKAIASPRNSLFVKDKKIYRGGEDDIPAGARILLGSVKHPGVRAANSGKGYLKPAIDKVRRQIRKEIPADVRKAALGTFRKAFK
jgi:hypothetical protein